MNLMTETFSPCPWYDRECVWPNALPKTSPCSLKIFLLLLSVSANVIDIPVASRVVVGVLVFAGRKVENMGVIHFQYPHPHSGKPCERVLMGFWVYSEAGLASDNTFDFENVLPVGQETQWGLWYLQSFGDLIYLLFASLLVQIVHEHTCRTAERAALPLGPVLFKYINY